MGTFADFEKEDNGSSGGDNVEWLKFEKNESKTLLFLSRVIPKEGEEWNNDLMFFYNKYIPPFKRGGYRSGDEWFFGFPELDENSHDDEREFVNVGELIGLPKKPQFMFWVSEVNGDEIEPKIYSAPKSVVKQLAELEAKISEKTGGDLRGYYVDIKRDDTSKPTSYTTSRSFEDPVDIEVIKSVELPAQLNECVQLRTVKSQIEHAVKFKDVILEITGKFPFDEEGNVVLGDNVEFEL